MKILIVEDDTLLLQGLILAAQTEGYACDGVSTARMAEQSLEAGHYSLVVLDLGLPDQRLSEPWSLICFISLFMMC